jgi:hypothetical protein
VHLVVAFIKLENAMSFEVGTEDEIIIETPETLD